MTISSKKTPAYMLALSMLFAVQAIAQPITTPKQQPSSGLSIGAEVAAWNPVHFSGPDKGTNHCPVCTHLDKPVILVFGKQTLNTISIARQLEQLAKSRIKSGLKCFVILTDGTKQSAKMIVDHYRLEHVGICLLAPGSRQDDLKLYNVDSDYENTIIYYQDYIVKANLLNLQSLDFHELRNVAGRPVNFSALPSSNQKK